MARSRSRARPIATRSSSRRDEIAGSRLDYLALGHWHSHAAGPCGRRHATRTPARRSPWRSTRTAPARSLLVELDEVDGKRTVTVEDRVVGRTTFERVELDAAPVGEPARRSSRAWRSGPIPDLVLDVRLVGVRPDELDLHIDEIEAALAPSFLKVRVRDVSLPALTEGDPARRPTPSPAPSSATSRRGSPSSRPAGGTARPPSCAIRCASAGCCWPATRSRCEGPQARAARLPPLPRPRHRPGPRPDRRSADRTRPASRRSSGRSSWRSPGA